MTTGNRLDRPVGVTVVPGMLGKVGGGKFGADKVGAGEVGAGDGPGWLTTAVIVASAGDSPVPWMLTVSVIWLPQVAVRRMWSVSSSSMA